MAVRLSLVMTLAAGIALFASAPASAQSPPAAKPEMRENCPGLVASKAPRAIPNLEAGLRSRFEGGLIAEVTRPDRATRRAILESKANDLAMPPAVLDLLAERLGAFLAELSAAKLDERFPY